MAKAKDTETEIASYDHSERPLAFVPKRSVVEKTMPEEERQRQRKNAAALWNYCVKRHKARWSGEAVQRGLPYDMHQGIGGWWFPKAWIADFQTGR